MKTTPLSLKTGFLFLVLSLCFSFSGFSQTYYFDGGYTDYLTDWWSNPDFTGSNPANFSLPATTWCICGVNDDTWAITIDGVGSKITIDNATVSDWDISIANGVTVDVTSSGSVTLNGSGTSSFSPGAIASGSMVIMNDYNEALPAGTYGNLKINNLTTLSGTYTVANDLTVGYINAFGSTTFNITEDLVVNADMDFASSTFTVGGNITYTSTLKQIDFNASNTNVTGNVTGNGNIFLGESTLTIGGDLIANRNGYDIDFETCTPSLSGSVSSAGDLLFGNGTFTIPGNVTTSYSPSLLDYETSSVTITGTLAAADEVSFGSGTHSIGVDANCTGTTSVVNFETSTVGITGDFAAGDDVIFGSGTHTIGGNAVCSGTLSTVDFDAANVSIAGNLSVADVLRFGSGRNIIEGNVTSTSTADVLLFEGSTTTIEGALTAAYDVNLGSGIDSILGLFTATGATTWLIAGTATLYTNNNIVVGDDIYFGTQAHDINGTVTAQGANANIDFETSGPNISGTVTAGNNITLGSGTITLGADLTASEIVNFETSNANITGTVTAGGDLLFGTGNHTVGGDVTGTGTGAFDEIDFEASGTVNITGNINAANDLFFGEGIVTVGGFVSATNAAGLVDFEGSGTVTVTGNVSGADHIHLGEGTVNITGNLLASSTSGELLFQGSTATITGNVTGYEDIGLNTSTTIIGGNLNYESGSGTGQFIHFNSSNTTIGGDLNLNGLGEVYFHTSTVDIAGDFNISNAIYHTHWNDGTITIEGDLDNDKTYAASIFYFEGTNPTITMDGSSAAAMESVSADANIFPKLLINKGASAVVSLGTDIKLGKGLVINAGELNSATNTLTLETTGGTMNAGKFVAASSGNIVFTSVAFNNTGGSFEINSGGQANLSGTFTNASTTTVIGDLTTTGTTSNSSSGTITVNGGNWTADGNVSNTGTTTVSNSGEGIYNAILANESTGTIVVNNSDITTNGVFTNNAAATTTLTNEGVFSALGNVTNNGTIEVEHQTSFIQGPSSALSGSGGTFDVSITSPTQWTNLFSYFSSPTTNGTIGYGANVTGDIHYSFRKGGEGDPDWTAIGAGQTMNGGEGYAVLDGDHISFSGEANNGNVDFQIEQNLGESVEHIWNLAGNPYPSPINAKDLIDDNADIGGAIYVWDQAANAGIIDHSGYAVINNVGSVGAPNYYTDSITADNYWIATGQGFMVEALNSSRNLTFKNIYRLKDLPSHTNTNLKGGNTEMLRFKLEAQQNGQGTNALLAFDEDATEGYDRTMDAKSIGGSNLHLAFTTDFSELSIQGLPFPEANSRIPVKLNCTPGVPVQLSLRAMQSISPYPFYYMSLPDSTVRPLDQELTIIPTTSVHHFELIFENPDWAEVGIIHQAKQAEVVWIKDHQNWSYIIENNANVQQLVVYNLAGQQMLELNNPPTGHNTLPIAVKGLYIAHIRYKNGSVSTKKLH